MDSSDAIPKARAPIGFLATLGVAALASIAIVIFSHEETTRPPPSITLAPVETRVEAVAPPSIVEPPPPSGVEAPAIVTVSFGSTPSGAEVRQGETLLCTTPCMQDLPRGGEQVVVFHRDGFFDETAHVTPEEGTPVLVRLRPRHRPVETGTSTAIKTTI